MASGRKPGRITLDIAVEAGGWPPPARLRKIAQRAVDAAAAGAPRRPAGAPGRSGAGELSLLFTDDRHMRALNRTWRKVDKSTNVLSFPSGELAGAGGGETQAFPAFLGDIALAFETIDRESKTSALTFEDHLTHLIVHGFLHLLGFDHVKNDEAAVMERLEVAILGGIGIEDPYRAPRGLKPGRRRRAN